MSTEVFVSYSSQDYERVMPLVDRLRSAGVAVGSMKATSTPPPSGPSRSSRPSPSAVSSS
ncbi:MAG: hypothetical protein Ct9H300mP7_7160 [Verrucomicrobiota bacterium]|nr:MAG: hypothetical protein Ct9H300mP7_7160 [Verrucomicrobiota bacterium]